MGLVSTFDVGRGYLAKYVRFAIRTASYETQDNVFELNQLSSP